MEPDVLLVLRRAFAKAREDDVTMVAQALAYSLFLAIPAGMLVVLGVFSLVADAATVESLIDRAQTVMPEEAATLLRDSLRRSTESPGSGIVMTVVGFALAIWTTTSAATTLMKGITVAYDGTESRGFVCTRLLAGLIVAALLLAASLVIGLLILGPHLENWIGGAVGAPTLTAWLWWTLQWPVLVVGLLLAFAVVLYLGPDTDRRGGASSLPAPSRHSSSGSQRRPASPSTARTSARTTRRGERSPRSWSRSSGSG